jgi:hypothetical protein
LLAVGVFDIEVIEALAFDQRNPQLFGLSCIDKHSFHVDDNPRGSGFIVTPSMRNDVQNGVRSALRRVVGIRAGANGGNRNVANSNTDASS